ncbi:MAG: hypothetical protein HYX26_08425 [Acidobacteriales bacterium]|nr:hypothetical protein [Terriglobales bacterium]
MPDDEAMNETHAGIWIAFLAGMMVCAIMLHPRPARESAGPDQAFTAGWVSDYFRGEFL